MLRLVHAVEEHGTTSTLHIMRDRSMSFVGSAIKELVVDVSFCARFRSVMKCVVHEVHCRVRRTLCTQQIQIPSVDGSRNTGAWHLAQRTFLFAAGAE